MSRCRWFLHFKITLNFFFFNEMHSHIKAIYYVLECSKVKARSWLLKHIKENNLALIINTLVLPHTIEIDICLEFNRGYLISQDRTFLNIRRHLVGDILGSNHRDKVSNVINHRMQLNVHPPNSKCHW